VLGLSANEPSALLVVLVVLQSGRTRGVAFVCGWIAALIIVAAAPGGHHRQQEQDGQAPHARLRNTARLRDVMESCSPAR
jgi:hypothetical protein